MLTADLTPTEEVSQVPVSPFSEDHEAVVGARFAELEQGLVDGFGRRLASDEVELARSVGVRFGHQVHTVEIEIDAGRSISTRSTA